MSVSSLALFSCCLALIAAVANGEDTAKMCLSNEQCQPPKGFLTGNDCFCVKTNGIYGYCKCVGGGHTLDCYTNAECQGKTNPGPNQYCYCDRYDPSRPGNCECVSTGTGLGSAPH